eukprot:8250022-Alexandrium_andersonii.AAC.1
MARRQSVSDYAGGVSDGRRAGVLLSGRRVAGLALLWPPVASASGWVHVWCTRALLTCCVRPAGVLLK